MIRIICFILMMMVSLAGQAKKPKLLVILHTNDTHSQIFPISAQLPDTLKAGRGGFLRRITMLKEERRKHPDLLYLDSGDFWQGSAYFTMFKGDVEIGLMNLMGIDASTIGNHEFDFSAILSRPKSNSWFPTRRPSETMSSTSEGITKPWIIIKRNGVKIGVFAVCPKLEGLVSAKNCPGVKYLDPAQVALETATMLKQEKKCDMVICISHLGWNSGRGEDDQYMIRGSRNIDLVLGGHTHTNMEQMEYENNIDGKPVPADQNTKAAVYVSKIVVDLK